MEFKTSTFSKFRSKIHTDYKEDKKDSREQWFLTFGWFSWVSFISILLIWNAQEKIALTRISAIRILCTKLLYISILQIRILKNRILYINYFLTKILQVGILQPWMDKTKKQWKKQHPGKNKILMMRISVSEAHWNDLILKTENGNDMNHIINNISRNTWQ